MAIKHPFPLPSLESSFPSSQSPYRLKDTSKSLKRRHPKGPLEQIPSPLLTPYELSQVQEDKHEQGREPSLPTHIYLQPRIPFYTRDTRVEFRLKWETRSIEIPHNDV